MMQSLQETWQTPLLHKPLQHSASLVHMAPSGAQAPPQMPPAQVPLQH
jgi:hypothetical protein